MVELLYVKTLQLGVYTLFSCKEVEFTKLEHFETIKTMYFALYCCEKFTGRGEREGRESDV